MRALVVEPGPAFSVADVHRGWCRGLTEVGCDVVSLNLGDRLDFYSQAMLSKDGEYRQAFSSEAAITMAAKGIEVAAYECWPDVVVITSAFFVPRFTLDLLRRRGHKVVIVHTESPYEDEGQMLRTPHADLNLLNDPTNLEQFRAINPATHYMPHRYDPTVHRPVPTEDELVSDLAFVGTGYPSRVAFLEAVDWSGIEVALAGNWQALGDDSSLRSFVTHALDECLPNDDAVRLYCSAKMSLNLYRREAEHDSQVVGWAMSPREVELAACGVPFLTEPRGENAEVLPFVPTFTGPGDLGDRLRWWLRNSDARETVALKAREAIADRTFANGAAEMLRLLGV